MSRCRFLHDGFINSLLRDHGDPLPGIVALLQSQCKCLLVIRRLQKVDKVETFASVNSCGHSVSRCSPHSFSVPFLKEFSNGFLDSQGCIDGFHIIAGLIRIKAEALLNECKLIDENISYGWLRSTAVLEYCVPILGSIGATLVAEIFSDIVKVSIC